ncbi:hypothetical protein KZX37_01380 [Microbacterium sp. EYE_5]|uniref:hypothetical protein n=1 Tax=unclassified Microbacterium TaxID=2609290 RepID=UPI002005A327|nr:MULTISPECIES: hypothetical protein [unclassified Microbacterium]MCK6079268.1 hypothetical protein [Microbacterium sp. EYE_382]MCK6084538.1 hypothetical protein [Microbacterium sp. EYE_384]MCK6123233.1 hypothetical protein [Microbacterium sp. EYE_80]MCK6125302.1 hypothetical protein [Microbacterium sp. EYE_79]MCK6140222.1 hypothetical protein [Microbacterium sp. EYE_39]
MSLTRGSERRAVRAAVRADRTGSGPTLEERAPARFPGAAARFALLGEVLLTGLLITLVGMPLVTLPIAVAAGIRHLRRFIAAEDSRVSLFWADVRAGIGSGLVVGVVVVVGVVALLIDIDVARSGFLPGGAVIEVVGWAGLAALAVALLAAASAWTPELGWRGAVRRVPAAVAADPAGALYLLAAAGFVVVLTWVLVPLLPAALGCAALAAVAVPERPRRAARR